MNELTFTTTKKEANNRFIQASIKERKYIDKLLKSKGIKDWQIKYTDENSFKRYDGVYENNKGELIVFEVKVRNVSSYRYKTTVIEESKYKYLLNIYKETGAIPYVFIFFTDGRVLIQNLLSNIVKTSSMYAPKTTSGNNTKVLKHFVEIPIDDLNTINFDISN